MRVLCLRFHGTLIRAKFGQFMKAKPAAEPVVFNAWPQCVVCLKMGYQEFEKRYAVALNSYWEDGLGPAHGRMFILSSGAPVYFCDLEYSPNGSYFECSGDLKLEEVLVQICGDFGLGPEDFLWTFRDAAFGSFVVTRQDDHGNEFEVGAFNNRIDAVRLKDELETYQHKQSYAIEGRALHLPKRSTKPPRGGI